MTTTMTADGRNLKHDRNGDASHRRAEAPLMMRAPRWIWDIVAYLPAGAAAAPLALGALALGGRGPRWLRERPLVAGLALTTGLVLVARWQLERVVTEKPIHDVVEKVNGLEIRTYPSRLVAETTVTGVADEDEARSEGFRRLAGYIFGDNAQRARIDMTAPVNVETASAAPKGERIAMTTPVTLEPTARGFVVTFTMPRKWSLATLPVPNDDRVVARERPSERVAVLRYRGSYEARLTNERRAELLSRVRAAGITPIGEPSFAGYDAPSTLPFLRRVEAWVRIG
jgi:hypothetical protein